MNGYETIGCSTDPVPPLHFVNSVYLDQDQLEALADAVRQNMRIVYVDVTGNDQHFADGAK